VLHVRGLARYVDRIYMRDSSDITYDHGESGERPMGAF